MATLLAAEADPERVGSRIKPASSARDRTHGMRRMEPKLLKGERIVYTTGFHWVHVFKALLPLVSVMVLGSVVWAWFPSQLISIVLMLMVMASVVWVAIKIFETIIKKAYVTNKRLIYRKGWTKRDTVDVTLDRIGGIKLDQDLWQRFFGYGTIQVIVPVVEIILPRFLRNPVAFRNALYMQKAPAVEKPDDDVAMEEEARLAKEREEREEEDAELETVSLSEVLSGDGDAGLGVEVGADVGSDLGTDVSADVSGDDEV